ncbi:hypothetical protein GCM10027418_16110 [Mariniluteicoccus endophyticus]
MPLIWHTDLDHGGRWWSLTTDTREWLWTNPDGAVALERAERVEPGVPFIDAGGGEECFPGLLGAADHGDAWNRVWLGTRQSAYVDTAHGRLTRRVEQSEPTLQLAYALAPDESPRDVPGPLAHGTHAVHLQLALTGDARLVAPAGATVAVLDHPAVGDVAEASWPGLDGRDLSVLGAPDGDPGPTLAILRGLASGREPAEVYVVDGDHMLGLRWSGDDPGAVGLLLKRDLGADRRVVVAPLVEALGATQWWLELAAYERTDV